MDNDAAMHSDAAMDNKVHTCDVCGAVVAAEATACGVCGAQIGASVPTGSHPPEDATNVLRVPRVIPDPELAAAPEPEASSEELRLTAAGLPSRTPRQTDDPDMLLEAFKRSWEVASEPAPATPPGAASVWGAPPSQSRPAAADAPPAARIDQFLRAITSARSGAALAAPAPRTPEWTAEPPRPVEPPDPVEPPEPLEPPKPHEPPPPPAPEPIPSPFPPMPAPEPVPPAPAPPEPGPAPDPVPPVPPSPPSPPVPPGPPIPPVPTPPPPPFPPPPGPVPPPQMVAARPPAATTTPGVYQGGHYGRLETQTITGFPASPGAPRRLGGTVYGGQTGLPTSANSDAPIEMSGSLTGMILSRGQSRLRRKERRARIRKVLYIGFGAIVFVAVIGLIVATLAGDFIRALLKALLD